MNINTLPAYDTNDKPTGCCPRFNPGDWNERNLRFDNMLFARVTTVSLFHFPLNIGSVFQKTFEAIKANNAYNENNFIILSHDMSPWAAEHYFAITKSIPNLDSRTLSGDFLTKVFEGSYKNIPEWENEMVEYVKSKGKILEKIYHFYTTCPQCAKYYGKNYVVVVAKVTS